MHEMGIAMEIIEIATSAIPEDMKGTPIEKVVIKIGKLSAIVPESLRFCFEIAVKDTALNEAVLVIEEIPVVAKCNDCDHNWVIDNPSFSCVKCESSSIEVLSGKELEVSSIEIKE